jgi:hypothetical protein
MTFSADKIARMKDQLATAASQLFTPGSKDDRDPEYLLETLKVDEIVTMATDCHAALQAISAKSSRGRDLFSPWAKNFIVQTYNLTRPYAIINGMHSLSGKQLVLLHKFWKLLSEDTAKLLADNAQP